MVKPSTAVAKAETSYALEAPPEIDYARDAGSGLEHADKDSFAVPFLQILQDLSPQVKKTEPEYIEGAEVGMIFNTVSQELMTHVDVIPCTFKRSFIEWVPRKEGGGFVDEYSVEQGLEMAKDAERDGGKLILANKNELLDTRTHYCLMLDSEGNPSPVIIAMGSSQIKKSRNWNSVMQSVTVKGVQAATRSKIYRLTTVPERNDQGSWYGWKIETLGWTPPNLYEAADGFKKAVESGAARAATESIPGEHVPGAAGDDDVAF